jgi:hypothetical protein
MVSTIFYNLQIFTKELIIVHLWLCRKNEENDFRFKHITFLVLQQKKKKKKCKGN